MVACDKDGVGAPSFVEQHRKRGNVSIPFDQSGTGAEVAHHLSEILARRRMGLLAAQDDLDAAARAAREAAEQKRILSRIETFFGLSG